MFGPRIQQYARRIAEMIVQPLAKLGITPNMATLIGLLLNCITATVLALGYLRPGGLLLLFADRVETGEARLERLARNPLAWLVGCLALTACAAAVVRRR